MRVLIQKGLVCFMLFILSKSSHPQETKKMPHTHTNQLIHETSPYLLQHAHNPVDWHAWGEEALGLAKKEGKLLLISVGYSACHWCHVMEHESFEDEEVGKIMNGHFVCIKVDREERPDIDHIYMTAVQLMTQRGGWPLNCVALPDGRPIWGGTYFTKENWKETLLGIAAFYQNNRDKTEAYAAQLQNGIVQSSLAPLQNEKQTLAINNVDAAVRKWKNYLDFVEGGNQGAPKFMLPNNLQFLLRYGHQQNDRQVLAYVETTLEKMAFGGVYVHIGGGFARYAVDAYWKVPHFEKMLYDNGQLLALYSQAWQKFKNPLYKQVAGEIVGFLKREMLSPENGFYSSLDADSDGEEGKFYVWGKEELQTLLKDDFSLFADYYNVNANGLWEHGNYILLRKEGDEKMAQKHKIGLAELQGKVKVWKQLLLGARNSRNRPALDDKILASWNALMITGLVDAYRAFGEKGFLDLALANAGFISSNMIKEDESMWHSFKNGTRKVEAFLEDYAFVAQAYIALFETTADKTWLDKATLLTDYTLAHFYDAQKGVFYFTSDRQEGLISRTIEIQDNVTPASNSAMAINLYKLGVLLNKPVYLGISKNMLALIADGIQQYPSGHSNWLQHYLNFAGKSYEVAICGDDAMQNLFEMQKGYHPNLLFCAGVEDNGLPLLHQRFVEGKTYIYVCQDKACQLPVETVEEARSLIHD